MNWEEYIRIVADAINVRENYQRSLGKVAHEITDRYGSESLKDFASEVKDTYGVSISASTLRNYRYVWERTSELDLPEDLSYRTLQYIASSENPKKWEKRINEEGLSSPEVYKLIREEKGLDKKVKKVECPHCHEQIELF
jgi:hypothetical protein